MSLVRKMQEGAKTPTLYTMYGKLYDFDELQRATDLGLAEHLSTLKRGSKDEAQFRDAYNNIMMGIKDGSITYQDGRFIDTKYGYHNSPDKDKNKDHYGLMANYIFNKMGKSPEYVKPEDKTKTKWSGSASIGNALIKELYNSDSENIRDFIDVDDYDETTKKRGTAKRAQRLSKAFSNVLSNFDTLFTGYTDVDKANATTYINDAIKYLNDGSIDAGDYLALSRAASGLNYRGMFFGGDSYSTQPLRVAESPESLKLDSQLSRLDLIREFMDEKHPQHTFTEKTPYDTTVASDFTYSQDISDLINKSITGATDSELYDIIRRIVRTPKEFNILGHDAFKRGFGDAGLADANGNPVQLIQPVVLRAILKHLRDNNKLQNYNFGESDPGSFYIPDSWRDGSSSGLVWNTTTGKILETDYLKIPYLRQQIMGEEFQKWLLLRQNGVTGTHWLDSYLYRDGGIIKAQAGVPMNRIGISQGIRGNSWLGVENTLANQANLDLWDSYYKNDDIDKAISGGFKFYNSGYEKWDGDNTKYGLSATQLGTILNKLDTISSGLSWDKQLNKTGFDEWNRTFDLTGLNIFFGGDSSKFKYLGPSTYNRHYLLERMKGQYNKENPLVMGEDKLYWDGHRWNLALPDIKPTIPQLTVDPTTLKPGDIKLAGTDPTKITPVTGDLNKPRGNGEGFLNVLGGLAPDLIGAGRLAISLNTNNRVAKTIRPSLNPVLKNTYERFSPITGDLYTRQSGYKRAGDIQSRFSKPITSDASLYTSTMLDANRQATALQSQADAADNQEIKRTAAEALARVEDNMARRSDVANFNRASMNLTNREIAQLEATRLKSNWQSWDNYLQGIEGRLRTKYETDKDRRDNFRLTVASNDIENTFQERIKDATAQVEAWRAANPGVSVTNMPGYRQYENLIKEATRWKNAETYAAHAGIYGYKYTNPYVNKSWADTASQFSFKTGGTLRPSALHLINKVIRNESNT